MKILISGSSGLVGSELQRILKEQGHKVINLVRCKENEKENALFWDPEQSILDFHKLEGFDVVINLAGASISKGRWTSKRKQEIVESRVKSTNLLSNALSQLKHPPKVFISASAVGYYGDRGNILCDEETELGKGFLADVCYQWEHAALRASSAGIRTVLLRFGVILSPKGGALAKMLTPFKLGLGGVLGSGYQYMSWVSIDDVIGVILHVIYDHSLTGAVNVVSPQAVTNREFTKVLAEVLHRPAFIPVPAVVLRLILGKEMANELLLSSTRVEPKRLLNSDYKFIHSDLKKCLKSS